MAGSEIKVIDGYVIISILNFEHLFSNTTICNYFHELPILS
jgi:hypothetical protein